MIICQPGDLVCFGTLTITAAHLTYGERAAEGAAFLVQQVKGAQAKIKARKAKRASEEATKKAVESVKKMVGRALVV
jgi:cutinase